MRRTLIRVQMLFALCPSSVQDCLADLLPGQVARISHLKTQDNEHTACTANTNWDTPWNILEETIMVAGTVNRGNYLNSNIYRILPNMQKKYVNLLTSIKCNQSALEISCFRWNHTTEQAVFSWALAGVTGKWSAFIAMACQHIVPYPINYVGLYAKLG